MAWSGAGLEYPDIKKVDLISQKRGTYSNDLHFEKTGSIGGGGNSGFQALSLALQFGARQILLIGFDMNDAGGKHWYGRNKWPNASNPDHSNFVRWIETFDRTLPKLMEIGATVINCSPGSSIKAFPIDTIENALARFDAAEAINLDRVRSA